MKVKIVWKGFNNVRHIYPRTHVIKWLLAQWGVPRTLYENLRLTIEFCKTTHYLKQHFGFYCGERDGIHVLQIDSDLILHLNQWDEFGPTGTHELRHLAWGLTTGNAKKNRNGFYTHVVTNAEEEVCKRAERNPRWIVGIDFAKLPFEYLKVRRRGYRFTQLELFS